MTTAGRLENAIETVYAAMAKHTLASSEWCSHCYQPEEIEFLRKTLVRELDDRWAMRLLREVGDHFPSSETYRHFLPRILEVLGPPAWAEDLFPGHLVETLVSNDFFRWPDDERTCVIEYLNAYSDAAEWPDEEEAEAWARGIQRLKDGPLRLP